ncbi:SSI family serine proteinase inhibitor [Streptomyces sp. NPDC088341]|uniref:SSI family serine proteinase inhibitor n=1 Tax=Streptomyces sp. NPDC088341 TaxID=3154870 RepID=UPI00343734C0
MRSIARGLALTATALAFTTLPGTGAASAAPIGAEGLYAPSALVLGITAGDNTTTGTVLRAVTLNCAPTASGTHPDATGACAELRAAGAQLDTITTRGSRAVCSKEWNPVTVTAEGVWEGKRFSYLHTFGNLCAKDSGSGAVFDF